MLNVVLLICGCLGMYAALRGPRENSRDCSSCRGRGCERCGWPGDADDRAR
ncbi:hypothetical protein ACW2Q0_00710 [Nocardia sp. R16R-3T]